MEFTKEQYERASGNTGIPVDSESRLDQAILKLAIFDYPMLAQLTELNAVIYKLSQATDPIGTPALRMYAEAFITQTMEFLADNYCDEHFPYEEIVDVDIMSVGRAACWVYNIAATATRNGHDLWESYDAEAGLFGEVAGVVEFHHDRGNWATPSA